MGDKVLKELAGRERALDAKLQAAHSEAATIIASAEAEAERLLAEAKSQSQRLSEAAKAEQRSNEQQIIEMGLAAAKAGVEAAVVAAAAKTGDAVRHILGKVLP
jgi:F-type H+-transporting ATPase subunit b